MFNQKKADGAINFIQLLNLVDDFYGQPFMLLPWQKEVLSDVYGTVNYNSIRSYRFAYLEIPKKNGKTTLIAGVALYHLVCDDNDGQIFCCAADKGQASIVYKAICGMRDQNEYLKSILKLTDSKKEIRNTETGTTLKVLSAEAFTKHGINPTVVIFDELHCQPNRELWDVMTFGAGATRKEPIWWVITTAGDDPDRTSIGWEQHEYARRVRDKEIIDDNWYVKIFGASEDDDIWDEEVWKKVNPSIGKAIDIEAVRKEAMTAKNSDSAERLFRWLRLNQWVTTKTSSWLSLKYWDSNKSDWKVEELLGQPCYGMLDLSSTEDLTTMCLLFPPNKERKEWRAIWETWIPEDGLMARVKKDGVPYDLWEKAGYMQTTPGDCIDYSYIKERVLANTKLFKVKEMGFDKYFASQLSLELAACGVKMVEVIQGFRTLAPPMNEVKRLLMTDMLSNNGNPVARWCFGNVQVKTDENANERPVKGSRTDRIDLFVALVGAMARALPNHMKKSKYTDGEVFIA